MEVAGAPRSNPDAASQPTMQLGLPDVEAPQARDAEEDGEVPPWALQYTSSVRPNVARLPRGLETSCLGEGARMGSVHDLATDPGERPRVINIPTVLLDTQ